MPEHPKPQTPSPENPLGPLNPPDPLDTPPKAQKNRRRRPQRMSTRERLKAVDVSLQARLKRVRQRLLPILQTSLASGLAYWISKDLFGHPRPFFAPIAVILVIGITSGDRVTKAVDIAIGCILGVLVGDVIFYRLGDGAWQIALIVFGSLVLASFLSKSVLLNNQVAIGCILIATIMPPGAEVTGLDRTVDAFVGCSVALLTLAIIPQGPMTSARSEIAQVMSLMSSVLDDVAEGLSTTDPESIREALDLIRGSQTRIDSMSAAVQSGQETAALSPFLWGRKRQLSSMSAVIPAVDNAVRNTRVLARRALVICEDSDTVSEKQIELIDALSNVALELSALYEVNSQKVQAQVIPRLVQELRSVAQDSGMDVVEGAVEGAVDKPVLAAYAILAQTRSMTVDMLQVCGMSRESALAALAPTSTTPNVPPETFDFD